MRVQTLRGAKLEESVLGVTDSRARSVVRVLEEGLLAAALGAGADAGSIFIGNRLDALRCMVAVGTNMKRVLDAESPMNTEVARRALAQKKPVVATAPDPDPHFCGARTSQRTTTVVAAKLEDAGDTLGLLQLVRVESPFIEDEVRAVRSFAQYITTSLIQTTSLRTQELLASRDPLTGLRNIRELESELHRAVGAARRAERDMALMFVDVDHLKKVNSKFGHAAGSEALRRTAQALDEAAAGIGAVFRFGGDEFVVVQRQASRESARALADHLRSHVAASTKGPMRPNGVLPKITVSVGVATLHGLRHLNGQPPRNLRARLMTTADRALFRAKAAGRNRVVVATGRDDRL